MKNVYVVRDNKVGSYFDPMFVPHLTAMMRTLGEVVADKNSVLAKYPQDFELYELGTFDESKGDLDLHSNPKFVLNITELVNKEGV